MLICCSDFGATFGNLDILVHGGGYMQVSFDFPKAFVDTTGKGNVTFAGVANVEWTEVEVYSVQ